MPMLQLLRFADIAADFHYPKTLRDRQSHFFSVNCKDIQDMLLIFRLTFQAYY